MRSVVTTALALLLVTLGGVRGMCDSSPCANGATCQPVTNATFACACPSLFTGVVCDTPVPDVCSSSPCASAATCVFDGVASFVCECAEHFTGADCQTVVDACESSPCVHGACNSGFGSYSCTCHSGWKGPNCQVDVYECGSLPCVNGGTCTDLVNGFECTCVFGWAGTFCSLTPEGALAEIFAFPSRDPTEAARDLFSAFLPPFTPTRIHQAATELARIMALPTYCSSLAAQQYVETLLSTLLAPELRTNATIREHQFTRTDAQTLSGLLTAFTLRCKDVCNVQTTTGVGSIPVESVGYLSLSNRSLVIEEGQFRLPERIDTLLPGSKACYFMSMSLLCVNTSILEDNDANTAVLGCPVGGAVEGVTGPFDVNDQATFHIPLYANVDISNYTHVACVYFKESSATWDTSGCSLVELDAQQAVCQCTHLSYVTLIGYTAVAAPIVTPIDAYTYVGAIIVFFACLIVLLIYCLVPALRIKENMFLSALSFSLGIAEIIFVASAAIVSPSLSRDECFVAGFFLYLFFLVVLFSLCVQWAYMKAAIVDKVKHRNLRFKEYLCHCIFWPIFFTAFLVGVVAGASSWDPYVAFGLTHSTVCFVPNSLARALAVYTPLGFALAYVILQFYACYKAEDIMAFAVNRRPEIMTAKQKWAVSQSVESLNNRYGDEDTNRRWTKRVGWLTFFIALAIASTFVLVPNTQVWSRILYIVTHVLLAIALLYTLVLGNPVVTQALHDSWERRCERRKQRKHATVVSQLSLEPLTQVNSSSGTPSGRRESQVVSPRSIGGIDDDALTDDEEEGGPRHRFLEDTATVDLRSAGLLHSAETSDTGSSSIASSPGSAALIDPVALSSRKKPTSNTPPASTSSPTETIDTSPAPQSSLAARRNLLLQSTDVARARTLNPPLRLSPAPTPPGSPGTTRGRRMRPSPFGSPRGTPPSPRSASIPATSGISLRTPLSASKSAIPTSSLKKNAQHEDSSNSEAPNDDNTLV